jgi:hypothetical protein
MRKLTMSLVLALVAAAIASSAALAKEGGVELSSTPFGSKPGDPWTGTMTMLGGTADQVEAARPAITITNLGTGEQQTFPAERTSKWRAFDFSVTFPEAGRYSVSVSDGVTGRDYRYPPVAIVGPTADSPGAAPSNPTGAAAAAGDDDGFPLWPVLGGAGGLLLLGAAAARAVRRRQLGLQH